MMLKLCVISVVLALCNADSIVLENPEKTMVVIRNGNEENIYTKERSFLARYSK